MTCGERIVDTVNRHREEYEPTPLYLSSLPPLQTLPQEALIVYFIGTPRVNRDGHQGGKEEGTKTDGA